MSWWVSCCSGPNVEGSIQEHILEKETEKAFVTDLSVKGEEEEAAAMEGKADPKPVEEIRDAPKVEEPQPPEPEPQEPQTVPEELAKEVAEETLQSNEVGSLSKGGPVIIIVVNPKSGGNVAGEFLKLPPEGLLVEVPNGPKATVFSYPIMNPEKQGFKHLAREVAAANADEVIRCIVAGGDGTVMWAIEEIFKAEIPISKVAIGTVPFGTGNDFGNVTRWGVSGPGPGFLKERRNFEGLHWYVKAWLRADLKPYDIWEVSVQTRATEKAGFQFIDGKKKQCLDSHVARHGIRRLPEGQFEMSKFVCNYFSFGLDARVGIGFDKSRQKNRILNKGVYAWEGAKKLLFKKKGVVGHIIDSMKELAGRAPQSAREGHDGAANPDGQVIFSTASTASDSKLVGNPVSLIFLNIPSIAGGLDIWKWSRRRLGTSGGNGELLKASQDFGDGRLECLSYRSGIGFYLEQLRAPPLSGQGYRVYSGGGPLRLSFRDPSDQEYAKGTAHCKGRTYMQVDGEFFIVHDPDTVVIRHHTSITVLVSSEERSCC